MAWDPSVSTAAVTALGVWSIFVTLGLPILGVAAIPLSGQASSSCFWPAVLGVVVLAVTILAFGIIVRSEDTARRIKRCHGVSFSAVVDRFDLIRAT